MRYDGNSYTHGEDRRTVLEYVKTGPVTAAERKMAKLRKQAVRSSWAESKARHAATMAARGGSPKRGYA